MLKKLKIDPEFQSKIPPLTFHERNQLETNILEEGRILHPLIVWNGLIVDGHTRYAILRHTPKSNTPFWKRTLQTAMRRSSGSAKISWAAAI